jgi:YfdX protein
MNKDQYQHKLVIYVLLVSSATLLATDVFAKSEIPKKQAATTIDRVTATTKHKALNEKAQTIEGEATLIEKETQKAIVALDANDPKSASAILKGVAGKLDNLLAKNPGLELVPAEVDADMIDFEGSNKEVSNAITMAEDLLKHGKLQAARGIILDLAS